MERQIFESMTLCPLDGRYSNVKDAFAQYFSEYALVKYRVYVEIQWLKFLIENIESDILKNFDQANMIILMKKLLPKLKRLKLQHVMMLKL